MHPSLLHELIFKALLHEQSHSFSFRWSLPPILGCNPKQPDSSGTDLTLSGSPICKQQSGTFTTENYLTPDLKPGKFL